MAKTAGDAI